MPTPERPEQPPRPDLGTFKDVRDANGHLVCRVSEKGFVQVRARSGGKPQLFNIFDHLQRRG